VVAGKGEGSSDEQRQDRKTSAEVHKTATGLIHQGRMCLWVEKVCGRARGKREQRGGLQEQTWLVRLISFLREAAAIELFPPAAEEHARVDEQLACAWGARTRNIYEFIE